MKKETKRKAIAFVCIFLVFVMILGIVVPFFANADILEEEEKKKELEYQKQLNTALTAEQKKNLQKLQNELTAIQADLINLDAQVTAVELVINDLTNQIELKQEEIKMTQADLLEARVKEDGYQILWAERIRAMYESPQKSLIELFVTAESMRDFWVNVEYQRSIIEYDNKVMHAIEDNRVQIETDLQIISEAEAVLEATLEEANIQNQELINLREQKSKKLAEIVKKTEAVETQLQRLILEEVALTAKIVATEKEINRLKTLESEARKLQESNLVGEYTTATAYRAAQEKMWKNLLPNSTKSSAQYVNGLYFLWPLYSYTGLSSRWGMRVHPIYNVLKLHTGQDIPAPTGTPIHATEAGVVLQTSYEANGLGYYIIIKHNNYVQSWYGHLSKISVKVGQTVKRGDVIGEVGSSGAATGAHLHFGIYINNTCCDPLLYVSRTYTKEYVSIENEYKNKK